MKYAAFWLVIKSQHRQSLEVVQLLVETLPPESAYIYEQSGTIYILAAEFLYAFRFLDAKVKCAKTSGNAKNLPFTHS